MVCFFLFIYAISGELSFYIGLPKKDKVFFWEEERYRCDGRLSEKWVNAGSGDKLDDVALLSSRRDNDNKKEHLCVFLFLLCAKQGGSTCVEPSCLVQIGHNTTHAKKVFTNGTFCDII